MKLAVLGLFATAISLGASAHSSIANSDVVLSAPLRLMATERVEVAARPQGKPYQSGMASWYEMGTKTASGARFNPDGLTAAHPTLPFDTKLLVVNNDNGVSAVVTVNDRGPFVGRRIIDFSRGAAEKLKMRDAGLAHVTIYILDAKTAALE